jgi:Two-component sensor kinase CbrA (EC 2.7.3.-)
LSPNSMTFSFLQVGLVCLVYLSMLFTVAYCTEKGLISQRIARHPVTYIFHWVFLRARGRITASLISPAILATGLSLIILALVPSSYLLR